MKVIKLFGKLIFALLVSIFGIIKIVLCSIIPIWNAQKSGYIWFGIFHQPFVVLFAAIPLVHQVEDALSSTDERLLLFMLITFEAIALTFAINVLIELIYYLCNKESLYANIQELQKYSNNYALIIISLIALYVSAFPRNSQMDNMSLLLLGCLFFISTISSDFYRIFIYSTGSVKDLSKKIKRLINAT